MAAVTRALVLGWCLRPCLATGLAAPSASSVAAASCQRGLSRHPGYGAADYTKIVDMNCNRVSLAIQEWDNLTKWSSEAQVADWRARGAAGTAQCQQAKALLKAGSAQEAAEQAVEAFGTGIMDGQLCCVRLAPPNCVVPEASQEAPRLTARTPAGLLIYILAAAVALACVGSAVGSCRKRREAAQRGGGEPEDDLAAAEAPPPVAAMPAARAAPAPDTELLRELHSEWLHRSCLRALPGARRMAASTAGLFASLQAVFEFQPDSVRNQFEHLLSLWLSHVAAVADRQVDAQADSQVDEQFLLADALDDLHGELLEGFAGWRRRFREHEGASFSGSERDVPSAGGASWEPISAALCPTRAPAEACERSRQLVEIAVYLLVWGEAGNVRFMPEVVYFITELALAAEGPGGDGFYGVPQGPPAPGGARASGRFLAGVVRPLYHLVFDEWYSKVEINDKGGDAKKLHEGFERYLPPDTANYDDWNEFFSQPDRMVRGLLLASGSGLFDTPHAQRFAALPGMHWAASLRGTQVKTHRECHSMWGVIAATHRVWLLHAVLFFLGVCVAVGDAPGPQEGGWRDRPLLGEGAAVRFAAVGLLVPAHALIWTLARMETTSWAMLRKTCGCCFGLQSALWGLLWGGPLATYGAVRYVDAAGTTELPRGAFWGALAAHGLVSVAGLWFLLVAPAKREDLLFPLTPVPVATRCVRYLFWSVLFAGKFLLGIVIFTSVHKATLQLRLVSPGRESFHELGGLWRSPQWVTSCFEWASLWATAFFMFVADTAMWFQLGCMVLGVCTVFAQRGWRLFEFTLENDIAKIPERLSRVVFSYAPTIRGSELSAFFPDLWDRVAAHMRYEDKIESDALGELSFSDGGRRPMGLTWASLSLASHPLEATAAAPKYPDLFGELTTAEVCLRTYGGWKRSLGNADLQWRLCALARGLGLPVPRPYRAPYIPGITVMIPHYGETIIMSREELTESSSQHAVRRGSGRAGGCRVPARETVPLIDWLKARYYDEFRAFTNRMQARGPWPAGNQWDEYDEEQWEKIRVWASMRMQTLWRTVAGMCLYHPALQSHFDIQGDPGSCLSQPGVWSPSDSFTCLVSMQVYKNFDRQRLAQTNKMFDKLPPSLKVAYIDWADVAPQGGDEAAQEAARRRADADMVHRRQARRYYSCLIDGRCEVLPDGRRTPRYRVELPGFAILGDGKSDNQNHAIPFMRGSFCQCIDANQGAYFEQMLMLPCVLGEFRTRAGGRGSAKRIIGLPEHITSDFGSIGDFAAGSEIAFGTISQRSFAVLGGRMHYGHPDIMNKQYMMQQGGVSKATKTINLSEDIFAGMDFTLRGEGRQIKHCEYFHVAKGRDLGFNAVLGFFSKLSGGTGEQLLTRQMLRLSHVLQLPEALTFYYAHAGYYITQYLVSMSMPVTVFTWLLVLTGDCNQDLRAFFDVDCENPAAEAMAKMLSTWYSVYILFFLVAASTPLFAEVWMQRGFGAALGRWLRQYATCAFLLFIFQAKIIGHYIVAEIRQGGASYVATGRGLPTDRREFVGAPSFVSFRLSVSLRGMDAARLSASAALRAAVAEAVRAAVAARAGLDPADVGAEVAEAKGQARAAVSVVVRPPAGTATIALRAKLGADGLGAAVAEAVGAAPGVGAAVCGPVTAACTLQHAATGWRVERVGGLYLDYTQHTYYHAVDLLFFTLCVIYVGGYSDAGPYKGQLVFTFLSLALVIFSWLYAPFIFNPYQFSCRYVIDDLKAWYGFFFADGGKNWVDWYERVVLKPKRGLSKSVFNIDFLVLLFAVVAWVSQLSGKQQVYTAVYSQDPLVRATVAVMLLPPFALSLSYCVLLQAFEGACGCISRMQRTRARRRARENRPGAGEAPESDAESDSGSEVEADARHAMEDTDVTADAWAGGAGCCARGVPLAVSAGVVAALQVIEAVVPLALCVHAPDRKLIVAGVVLKALFWKVVLHVGESALSMRGACRALDRWVPSAHRAGKLLVFANQMARDIFVSTFIFVTLGPVFLLTALNDMMCPRFSIHQALIYRAAGPLAKKHKRANDEEEGEEDDDLGSEGSAAELAACPAVRPPDGTHGPPPGWSTSATALPGLAARDFPTRVGAGAR